MWQECYITCSYHRQQDRTPKQGTAQRPGARQQAGVSTSSRSCSAHSQTLGWNIKRLSMAAPTSLNHIQGTTTNG
jgi:hypothetical protein